MMRDDDLFGEAIALPPEERGAFLDRACAGDPERRARLTALLAGYESVNDFLEQSPVERPVLLPEEKPGDTLGRYTLVRQLGEGGYGVVYLAEQREPVRRQVALKIIKLGMDTRQVIMRFEAERQALALMEHADIAHVLDAGTTTTGRPYFVMEFVDGVPITRFCDEHGLPVAARLELFARVCLAIQHAHQKGIIHRDLKPSNILVALRDGLPTPKVIDFGIAKATQGRLTDQTLVTAVEQFIGTPAYMSPEQAERREVDIDTRSDIYSLGVLLYELLAGRPPYDPKTLGTAGIEEIRRIIRDVEPARPSARVATLDNSLRVDVARLRGVEPVRLTAVLRGDLDWIVMRCLEKDRERRYGTAHELADDVRRHLRSEPVTARPPSTVYRARKFVARNRLACASAAAVSVSLVAGTVVSVRQAVRATRAERVAKAERTDAQRRQEQAEALLAFMIGDFRSDLKKLGRLDLLDAIGDKAMAYFAELDPRDLTDTALTRQAKALTQIGETRIDQAKFPEADAAFAAAYARAATLTSRHPQEPDMLFERAQVEYWRGFLARRRGDFVATRDWLTRYRDSAVALVALEGKKLRAQRELTSGQHNLAVLDFDHGDFTAAQAGFLRERAAVEEMLAGNPQDNPLRFRLADVESWLARTAESDGRYAVAIARYGDVLARLEELVAAEPREARWRFRRADGFALLGHVLAIAGRTTEAAEKFARARKDFAELVAQDPKNQQWLFSALSVRVQQAALRLAAGDNAENPELEETRAKLESMVAAEPSSRPFAGRLATVWLLEAQRRLAVQRDDALVAASRAQALGETLVKEARSDHGITGDFARACVIAGRAAQAQNQPELARRHWNRALETLGPLLPNASGWRLLDPAMQAFTLLGREAEARPLIDRLRGFGYRSLDPFAASLLGPASSNSSPPRANQD